MKTFGEYVTTPGRPAATSPASRTRAAAAHSRSSDSSARGQQRGGLGGVERGTALGAREGAPDLLGEIGGGEIGGGAIRCPDYVR